MLDDKPRRSIFNRRIAVVALHDLMMAMLAFELAVVIAYSNFGNPQPPFFLWHGTTLFVAVCAPVFWFMGLYRGIWRFASFSDLAAIARSVALAVLLFLPALFFITRAADLPRSAMVMLGPLLVLLLAGPRLLFRAWKDRNLAAVFDRGADLRVPVLLVGAEVGAETFIREMRRRRDAPYRVVGLIDVKASRVGRDIQGVRVLGVARDLEGILARLERRGQRPQRVIIAADHISGEQVGALLDDCDRLGLPLARLPRLTDFQSDEGRAMEVRPVDVEDLLGRSQKVLDRGAMRRLVTGRRVLVTGAGGTIGAELCRQVAELGPARLILLDNGEYNLYQIDMELAERWPGLPRAALLGDVRDRRRLEAAFAAERPELVFHAAAFKHVPLVEENPAEGVLTNVFGTRNVADLCRETGVCGMVLISTDKAVNPSSVMGASKRLAEMYCQSLSLVPGPTRFVTVRFGNVLGSTGSVVPLFQRQLARGGPLTVTHPDVTRYFMTVREAVELTLQASALPPDGAGLQGKIFVLDMGRPVRIQDLARQMIRLSGRRPDKDVAVVFTGLRAGEKLHEELLHASEHLVPTDQQGILLAAPRVVEHAVLAPQLDSLAAVAEARRREETLALVRRLVPEFDHCVPAPASVEAAAADAANPADPTPAAARA